MAKAAKAKTLRLKKVGISTNDVLMVALEMAKNIDVRDRKQMLRKYPSCFVASEAVRWMVRTGHAEDEDKACVLGHVMQDHGLIAHYDGKNDFANTANFFVFLGPCVSVTGGTAGAGCRAFSAAEAAVAAAAAAEVACATTPGCRLLKFLHEHEIEDLYEPLFVNGRLDYNDVMLACVHDDVSQTFLPLGISQRQIDQLRSAVTDSIDRRMSQLGRGKQLSSTREGSGSSQGSSSSITDKGKRDRMLSSTDSRGASAGELRAQIEFDAAEGPPIRSWAITNTDEVERDQFIAEGTSGKVYRGRWQGMAVAVKVFKPDALEQDIAINEIQLMRRMQHQSLLRLYGGAPCHSS